MSRLQLEQVSKSYDGTRQVLDRLELDVAEGELVSLLGPSGCGKSTALRIVGGLIPLTGGRILVSGRDVSNLPSHARNMGLVFQSYALFPHLSVEGNVAFGLEMRGVRRREAIRRAGDALEMVRLSGLGGRMPRQLSGGQQQRVALARALVIRPDLLLLDEPLSNLDAKLRDEMRVEIRELQRRSGITTLFVTHDQAEALAMSDRVAVLDDGKIVQYGTPVELYDHPVSAFVASFIGRVNTIPGRAGSPSGGVTPIECDDGSVAYTTARVPAGPAVLMVRPQRMRLGIGSPDARAGAVPGTGPGALNRMPGTVTAVTFAGEVVQVAARVAGTSVLLECPSHDPFWVGLSPGDAVTAEWEASHSLAFAAAG